MKKIILPLIVLIAITSCTNNARKYTNPVFLKEKDLPPLQQLQCEQIDLPADLYCDFSYVYHDTLFIAINQLSPNPYFITIYNMKNWEVVGNYYMKGNGPNELLSLFCWLKNDHLLVQDYMNYNYYQICIDSALAEGDKYHARSITLEFTNSAMLSDSETVVLNKYYFDGANGFSVPDTVKEFYKIDMNHPERNHICMQNQYLASNVNFCNLLANQKRKLIFCGYGKRSKCAIMDYDFNVMKTIVGPDNDDVEFLLDKLFGYEIVTRDMSSFYSGYACCDDEFVYIANHRVHKIPTETYLKMRRPTEIFKFDWDGNLVGRYKKGGNEIKTISISESQNVIYMHTTDEDGELALYKAQL